MQAGHRRRQTQAKSGTWLGAALLEPHEALDGVRTIGLRYSGTAVTYGELDAVALAAGRDQDLGRRAIGGMALRLGVFDGVVHQVGERLADQLAVTLDRSRRCLDPQGQALGIGERLLKP